MDAAIFLDVPQYVPPVPQIMPHRAAAQAMQSLFGAEWDPACAAAQPVIPSPRQSRHSTMHFCPHGHLCTGCIVAMLQSCMLTSSSVMAQSLTVTASEALMLAGLLLRPL